MIRIMLRSVRRALVSIGYVLLSLFGLLCVLILGGLIYASLFVHGKVYLKNETGEEISAADLHRGAIYSFGPLSPGRISKVECNPLPEQDMKMTVAFSTGRKIEEDVSVFFDSTPRVQYLSVTENGVVTVDSPVGEHWIDPETGKPVLNGLPKEDGTGPNRGFWDRFIDWIVSPPT